MIRSETIDNAKFLMIFLVVFGHLIESIMNNSELIKITYLSIYSFHIPVFIILSGMLSKPECSEERTRKTIISILIPFVSFTFLYEIFNVIIHGNISNYSLNFQPYWILWFLFSLFLWKLFLPIILNFRFPILISIFISLGAGYVDSIGYFLGIAKTLYFFPFFLIGHQLSTAVLSNQLLLSMPKPLFCIILILNVAFFWWLREFPHQWLYGSFSYKRLDIDSIYGAAIRLSMYAISAISAVAVIMLIPSTKSKISKLGENSLYVYVWHGFFVNFFVSIGLIGFVGDLWPPITLTIILFGALILTFVLSTKFVAQNTQNLILNPVKNLLLNKS